MSNYRQIIMTEWHTISGRFTAEEVDLIKKFQKRLNLSDNQLVRQGVQVALTVLSVKDLLEGNKTGLEFFKGYTEELSTELNSEKYQKLLNKTALKVAKKFKEDELNKFEEEVNRVTKDLDVFNKKRARGRKPELRNVGRPRNDGN